MKNTLRFVFALLALVLGSSVSVFAALEHWPEFRGPTGQGISAAENPPVSWDSQKGVAWRIEIPGKGWSSPVLSEGMIVLTSSKETCLLYTSDAADE